MQSNCRKIFVGSAFQRAVHQPLDVGDGVEDTLANLRVMQCAFLPQPAQGALRQLCGDDDVEFIDNPSWQYVEFFLHGSTSPRYTLSLMRSRFLLMKAR